MHKKSIRRLAQFHGWWIHKGFLTRTSAFNEDQRREWIDRALQQTLVRAFEGTRYYKEAFAAVGFDPRTDFTGPEILADLPRLTKDILRERRKDLVDDRFRHLSATAETSGTTGRPMSMQLNESYIALDYACMYRMWSQAGYRFRDPFVALRSYVPSGPEEPLWKHDAAQNTLFMSAYHFSPRNAADYLQAIESFQPRFLRAYPSSLLVLAEHLHQCGRRLPSLRGLFTASETLTDHERSRIESVFGPILFDWYGMTEPTLVAFESPEHDGLNVVWQYGHAEMVPDPTLSPDSRRLIATSLQNPVMPFIRYETGDLVTPHPDNPSDLYPTRFARIDGRKDDLILTPDGRRLPSVNFYSVFRSVPGIVRFQIVQYGSSEIVVNLDTQESTSESHPEFAAVRRELQSRFGDGMNIEYRLNRGFETSADGKTPVILRRQANKAIAERNEYVLSSQTAWSRHLTGESIAKLDWNESDQLPTDAVRQRLMELLQDPRSILWYPEAEPSELLDALARHHQVQGSQLVLSPGSDVALQTLVQCYLTPGDKAIMVTPSYDQFRAFVEQAGSEVIPIPFEGEPEFPWETLQQRLREHPPRLLYLSQPNNPFGYLLPQQTLRRLCRLAEEVSCLVIADEAYAEFASETAIPLLIDHPNLVITRTFSKACGLAGLRIGYVLCDPSVRSTLNRALNPKNLSTFAQAAALATLENWSEVQRHIGEVVTQRERWISHLRSQGISCWNSQGNYVLSRHSHARELAAWLEQEGVLVRERCSHVADTIRVTLGSEASTDRLIEAFDLWSGKPRPTALSQS